MDNVIQLLAALAGSFGFAALFNLHGKKLAFAALGGLLSWSVYLLLEHWNVDAYACAFAASVALTLYAELMARCHKSPVTVFLVTAAIPLIPGAGLYRTVNYLMLRSSELATSEGLHTLLFAASMSAGITLTTLIFQILQKSLRRCH